MAGIWMVCNVNKKERTTYDTYNVKQIAKYKLLKNKLQSISYYIWI